MNTRLSGPISSRNKFFSFFVLLLAAGSMEAADWPQFRGPNGNGLCHETTTPLHWDRETNIVWRTKLPEPGNNGSPIVTKGRVLIAVADEEGHKRSLHCYDKKSGTLLWARDVKYSGDEPAHKTNLYGCSTPVADGERIIVWHSSAGMHCYDYQGELLWSRDLGKFDHIWGYGSSPIRIGDLVIQN